VNIKTCARIASSAAIAASPIFVAANGQQIELPLVTQTHSEWCWAAASKAILAYRGVSSTQCGIANWVGSIGYACRSAPFDWNDPANSPNTIAGTTGISGILWSLGRHDSRYYSVPLSFGSVVAAVDRGDPVVILWTWWGGGGHFIVVHGYDDRQNTLYFMNPWPGEGEGYGDYRWMRYGSGDMGTHSWAESLVVY